MAAGRPYPSYEEYKARYERAGRSAGRKKRPKRLLILIAALCAAAILLQGRVFVLKEIRVSGNALRSDSEVAGLIGLSLGTSIFRVDADEVRESITADNYLEVIKVSVNLPDTVSIEVKERTAQAAINCAGVILVTDGEGFILERLTSVPQERDVIVVSGLDVKISTQGRTIESGKAGQMAMMKKVLRAVTNAQAQELISELNVADPDNLYLVSESGVQILLGDDEQLDVKLLWMRAVLEELTKNGVMSGVLDVSSGKNAVYADR